MKFLAAVCLVLSVACAYSSVIPISGTSLITSEPGLVVSGHAVVAAPHAPVVVAAPHAVAPVLVAAPPAKSVAIHASVVPTQVVVPHHGLVLAHGHTWTH